MTCQEKPRQPKGTHQRHLELNVQTASDFIHKLEQGELAAGADNVVPVAWAQESFNIAVTHSYNLILTGDGIDSKGILTLKQRFQMATNPPFS
jgi:hypothetical protein